MSDDGRRSGPNPSSTSGEHDAWLREALRHAPDASASPPPSLRDAILAEARAAARAGAASRMTAPRSLLDRALDFWSWLARPQVAAGFASVMAATLVGMLWWDRPMDETRLPPPSSPAAAAPKVAEGRLPAASEKQSPAADADKALAQPADRLMDSARARAAPPAPRDATPAAAKAAPSRIAADRAMTEAAPKPQIARETAAERERAQAEAKSAARTEEAKSERKDDRLESPPAPSINTAPATSAVAPPAPAALHPAGEVPSPFPAQPPTETDAATRQATPMAATPAPLPANTQPPAAARGRAEPFALAKKAESGEKESAAARARSAAPMAESRAPAAGALGGAALDRSEAGATGRATTQNAAGPESRQPAASAASSAQPMAPLLAALASEEARWSRRLANGESAAVDAAVRGWLAQVQSAAPRWDAAAERNGRRDAATLPVTALLRLERDGRAGALVQIEDGGVLFDPLSGSAWFAALPPEVVARLRATLPPAPR
jgi:hypothetical protein